MDRVPVNSRAVTSIGWEKERLQAEYPNGDVYDYTPISKREYDDLMASQSIGSALAAIRRTHRGIKV